MPEKWVNLLVAALLSALLGGGSGMLIESEQQAALRTKVAELSIEVNMLKTVGSEQSQQLKEIDRKVEEGNKYLRDEVVKALSDMKADIAVLKARR